MENKETQLQPIEKELIESYKLAFSRYNYNVWEKRIIYNILRVQDVQTNLKERITDNANGITREYDLFNDMHITMPLSAISDDPNDYKYIKEGLRHLNNREFTFEDENHAEGVHFIMRWQMFYKAGERHKVKILMSGDIYNTLLDVSRGFRRFNFGIVMSLRSGYAMRFYEMFCYQDVNVNGGVFNYKIADLREMMCKGKYATNNRFIEKVIKTAKKELDEVANYSFDFKPIKSAGSRAYDTIEFKVYHIPQNERNVSAELKENRELNLIGQYARLSTTLYNTLQEIGFSADDIHANLTTFFVCEQDYMHKYGKYVGTGNLLDKIDKIKERGLRGGKTNINGYIISALKSDHQIMSEERKQAKVEAYVLKLQQEKN